MSAPGGLTYRRNRSGSSTNIAAIFVDAIVDSKPRLHQRPRLTMGGTSDRVAVIETGPTGIPIPRKLRHPRRPERLRSFLDTRIRAIALPQDPRAEEAGGAVTNASRRGAPCC